jgi:hypothetical protein
MQENLRIGEMEFNPTTDCFEIQISDTRFVLDIRSTEALAKLVKAAKERPDDC